MPEDNGPAARLLGNWRLEEWAGLTAAGRRVEHGGSAPTGDLNYLPSGRMAVQIQSDGRSLLGSLELDGGTDELQAGAFRTYIAYAGRFSVPEPGIVVHHVEQSLRPDQVGIDKRREYELNGDRLTLRTEPLGDGDEQASSELIWRRST